MKQTLPAFSYSYGIPQNAIALLSKLERFPDAPSRNHFYAMNGQYVRVIGDIRRYLKRTPAYQVQDRLTQLKLSGYFRNYFNQNKPVPAIHSWQQREDGQWQEIQKTYIYKGINCPGPQNDNAQLEESAVSFDKDGRVVKALWLDGEQPGQAIRLAVSTKNNRLHIELDDQKDTLQIGYPSINLTLDNDFNILSAIGFQNQKETPIVGDDLSLVKQNWQTEIEVAQDALVTFKDNAAVIARIFDFKASKPRVLPQEPTW